MPAGGGMSQTAVNRLSGARSHAGGAGHRRRTLLTMLFLAPFVGLMPQATLAAMVMVYSVGCSSRRISGTVLAVRRTEFIWVLAALVGVMPSARCKGILVAIIVSLVALASRWSPRRSIVLGRKPGHRTRSGPLAGTPADDETFPGLLMSAPHRTPVIRQPERVSDRIRPLMEAKPRIVALDLSGIFDLEYPALKMITEAEARQREAGITLWLVGLTPEVLELVQRSPLGRALGDEHMFWNVEQAVARYQGSPAG